MSLKHVQIHRSLTRQQLLLGCDRELFFLLVMLCGLLFMSGVTRFDWKNILASIAFWAVGTPVLAKLAIYDPHFRGVVLRSARYLNPVLPANGKPGLPPITHKRWD